MLAVAILTLCVNSPLDTPTPERASTFVQGSIEASLVRVEGRAGPALAAQVARLVRWRGDVIRDVHPGDRISVLFDREPEPRLVALAYDGAAITLHAYSVVGADGVPRFYDGDGVLVEPALEDNPVPAYIQITEVVQSGRGKRRHMGLDLKAPLGAKIHLPYAAKINRVNWSTRRNGQCVEVIYTDGPAAGKLGRFLHLSVVDPAMVAGASLAAGTRVGEVGSTGHSLAPHLHYEIRGRDGSVFNPIALHGSTHPHLPTSLHDAFADHVEVYERRMAGEVASN